MRSEPQTKARPGLALIFFAIVFAVLLLVHRAGDSHYDFGVFYYAARMVNAGAGSQLYDLSAQHAWQAALGRPASQLFYYPPYSLLPFLPLAVLPIAWAYAAWTALSLALLAWNVKVLAVYAQAESSNWPWLLALAFMPVATCLAHGQLSLVVLTGFVLTHAALVRGKPFAAGLLLTLAAFKFQLVAGFVAVLFLRRKWTALAGLLCGAAALLAISLLIGGTQVLAGYGAFVIRSEGGVGSEPENMANWRGLATLFTAHPLAVVLVLSLATVLWAARAWTSLDRGFSAAMLATLLTSYHANPQDLLLCMVPFCFCLKEGMIPVRRAELVVCLVLLAPMALAAARLPYALLALPIAGAVGLLGVQRATRREAPLAQSS